LLGVVEGEETLMVALGVEESGEKHVLGVVEGEELT